MITLENGNKYTIKEKHYYYDAKVAHVDYLMSNDAAQALGYPIMATEYEIGSMPQIQAVFNDGSPEPSNHDIEEWLISNTPELSGGVAS